MAVLAGIVAPAFAPIGLADWRIVTSLVAGFMAKESVVSTMEILFLGNIEAAITVSQAAAILVFSLLYTPCVAAITSIKRELGKKYAVCVVLFQCGIAYAVALIVRLLFMLF